MNKLGITSLHRQKGYLMFVAVLLILLVGAFSVTMTSLFVGSAHTTGNFIQADNAYYLAEAGFEETARLLLTPILSGTHSRIACGSITGNSNLTNTSFGPGTFTATTVTGSPVYMYTTLSSAIGNADTTIAVTSTGGFASAGRLVIDREIVNYGGISGNSFVGIQRGVNMSYNTPHANGTPVAQYQCNVSVTSGIPNLTSSLYQKKIQQSLQLQEGWAGGALSGSSFVLTRWNRPTEVSWNSNLMASTSAATINSISMLSNADGWAVGNVDSLRFTLLRWNGFSWNLISSPSACSNQHLQGVSSVYMNEAWAVGPTTRSNGTCTTGGARRYTVLRWNGTSWTALTPSTTPAIPADNTSNQNLNAVHVIDATKSGAGTLGFTVGSNGIILQYDGTNWIQVTSPTTTNLRSVYIVSPSEAWAVGNGGTILKWNGATWSLVTSPTTRQLNSINMLDYTLSGTAKTGWAVGNSGTAIAYNGSTWSSSTTGSSVNLFGVALFFTNPNKDVWAVGESGTILHFDGTSWSSITSNVSQQLNAISLIPPQQYSFADIEIFP
jgi:Tfp pilus assembly protein PilX